jgi:hypothetical protein
VFPDGSVALAFVHPALEVPHDAPDDLAGVVANVAGAPVNDLARAIRERHELVLADGRHDGCDGVGDPS